MCCWGPILDEYMKRPRKMCERWFLKISCPWHRSYAMLDFYLRKKTIQCYTHGKRILIISIAYICSFILSIRAMIHKALGLKYQCMILFDTIAETKLTSWTYPSSGAQPRVTGFEGSFRSKNSSPALHALVRGWAPTATPYWSSSLITTLWPPDLVHVAKPSVVLSWRQDLLMSTPEGKIGEMTGQINIVIEHDWQFGWVEIEQLKMGH